MDKPRSRPVIDMTPEGEFRDPSPPRRPWLDRALARVGAYAVLAAVVAGGLVVAALAVVFAAVLLPIALLAGAVGFGALWWRARRARREGRSFIVVIRR
ncbi:MAG: hypothetical protein N2Z67_09880 [Acetobacteraceae bacterium]|nr:hypothetical protein [Acetobacteraceae bacterium]